MMQRRSLTFINFNKQLQQREMGGLVKKHTEVILFFKLINARRDHCYKDGTREINTNKGGGDREREEQTELECSENTKPWPAVKYPDETRQVDLIPSLCLSFCKTGSET